MPILVSQLKAIRSWLEEKWYAWFAMAIVSVALCISFNPYTTERAVRVTGLVLQLLGICTVIWGIYETRKLFGHPSFLSELKAWLVRFPLLRRNVVITPSVGIISLAGLKGRAYGTHGAGVNPTVESRLVALERNVEVIHARIRETQEEMDKELQKIADALKSEEQSRQSEDKAIREKLEATGTGGVHISLIGALWLFVGVILSTVPKEIACLCLE